MYKCPNCDRIFEKQGQMHSCKKVPLDQHFQNKDLTKKIFEILVKRINDEVGKTQTVSLPCCIHLYGKYDFIALLPKADRLEIRIALDRVLSSERLVQSVPLSSKTFKNCLEIRSVEEIDAELIEWIKESYHLKD